MIECHRQPPIGDPGAMSLQVSALPEGADAELAAMHDEALEAVAEIDFPRWPRVLESDWCGEYLLRPDGFHDPEGFS